MARTGPDKPATRGLATVALLKVNFDAGKDHIAMFQPFVLDTVAHLPRDGFTVQEVRESLHHRHQLKMPTNTLRTLLGRAVKHQFLRREAGRYFLGATPLDSKNLSLLRQRVEQRQLRLANELREYAKQRRLHLEAPEDALAAILRFIDQHHVTLALDAAHDSELGIEDEDHQRVTDRRTRIVAAFLHEHLSAGGEYLEIIQEMLEGFILQNALLLKDISAASRRFRDLEVFLDTGLLLGALGFRGEATETATREALSLLRETGARLSVLEVTIREIDGILSIYEDKLGTPDGRLSLHPTEVTRFFLTKGYSPSDVRQERALLARNMPALGANIRALPRHRVELTLDEADLATRLADRAGGENDPRVVHDVHCIAAILTLRGGKRSDSLDDARAVFATTSTMTVSNVSAWYEAQGDGGVSPIVHHLTLSNLAWLKRPASGATLKLHELVALCAAALRPPRRIWDSFLHQLKKLKESGQLSSDEATAIVASEFADRILADELIEDDLDASSISEVIDRVKRTYREEADGRIEAAELAAQRSERSALSLRMSIERRSRSAARLACWTLATLVGLAFLTGGVVTIVRMGSTDRAALWNSSLVGIFTLGSLMSTLWGFNVKGWRDSLEEHLAQWLKTWMTTQA